MRLEIVLSDEVVNAAIENDELGVLFESIGNDINLAVKSGTSSARMISSELFKEGDPIGRWTNTTNQRRRRFNDTARRNHLC